MLSLKNQNRIGILCLIFSISFSFLSLINVFQYKYISAGDTFWHYSNEMNLVRSLEDGQGIFSCFSKGLGTPLLCFYQPLFYLIVALVHIISFKYLSVYFIHNLMVVLLFSIYPLSVFYFARSFEFTKLKSGIISIFCLFPISSCGHTIDAYLSLGVHTQLLGTVFLPVVLGSLHRLANNQNQARTFIVFTISLFCIVLGHAVFTLQTAYIIPLYLIFFIIWYKWFNFFIFIKKLFLAAIITLLLTSFWLIPFILLNNEYRYVSPVERSGSSIYHSLSVKDFFNTLLSGQLLDNTRENSVLLSNNSTDKGLRWSDNSSIKRYCIFTIFSLSGFLLFLLKARKFRDFYLIFLFIWGTLLFLGTDDIQWIKFLPSMHSFQNIRAILIVELLCAVFSGILFEQLVSFALNIFYRNFYLLKKINGFFCKSFGSILFLFLLILLIIPLYERYQTTIKLIDIPIRSKSDELENMFSSIKKAKNTNILPRIIFNEDALYRSFADCFYLNNATGLDNFVGSNLAWLINDIRNNIANTPSLLDLLGIKYTVFEQSYNSKINPLLYDQLSSGNFFCLGKVTRDSSLFFIPKNKPVLVYCNENTWYYLNKIWLKIFIKKGDIISHLIRVADKFDSLLNPDYVSSIILLNFPESETNKQLYFNKFKDFVARNGNIYSNRTLWGLSVKKIISLNEKSIEDLLIIAQKSVQTDFSRTELTPIDSKWYAHTLKYISEKPQFIVAKTIYYPMWNAFSKDIGRLNTYRATPGFVGFFPNETNGIINFYYSSSKIHIFLCLLGIGLVISMLVWCKKRRFVFNKINFNYINSVSGKNTIYRSTIIITLIFIIYLSVIYFQQTCFLKTALIYPLDNQKRLSPLEITFHWNKMSDNEKYFFQISENKDFTKIVSTVKNRDKNFLICKGFQESHKYYWRVKIIADWKRNTSWSNTYVFTTGKY